MPSRSERCVDFVGSPTSPCGAHDKQFYPIGKCVSIVSGGDVSGHISGWGLRKSWSPRKALLHVRRDAHSRNWFRAVIRRAHLEGTSIMANLSAEIRNGDGRGEAIA